MHLLSLFLRRLLAKRGYLLFHVHPALPPTFEEFLRRLRRRGLRPDAWFSFDNEAEIQTLILTVFPAEMVAFESSITARPISISDQPTPQSDLSNKHFCVEIDAETFDLERLVDHAPWILRAQILMIRATLGFFWSGRGDLCRLAQFLQHHGFRLYDVLDYAPPGLLQAPLRRIISVFAPTGTLTQLGRHARHRLHRTSEALAYLSTPVAQSEQLNLLAGRGSFGFPGGLFNPGAVSNGRGTLLLGRGERTPWVIQKRNESVFLSACRPVLMTLTEDHAVDEVAALSWLDQAGMEGTRREDFRLFRYQDRLFTNHSVITIRHRPPGRNRPLQMQSLRVRVGISLVDLRAAKLEFLGFPHLDRTLSTVEKNWVVFAHNNEIYLVYSFYPYQLLRATRWPEMIFKTVIQAPLPLPFAGADCPIRNSVNPVDYDDLHFLHIVHQVYPYKRYVFWAVLIDKTSLLPTMVSARPLVRGWHSTSASIIYACSVVLRDADIFLFAGIDDSGMGFWRIPRSRLDSEWRPLSA